MEPQNASQPRFHPPRYPATSAAVRRFILLILLIGLAGTLAELLLLGHDEEPRQVIPIAIIGSAFLLLAWHGLRPRPWILQAFRLVMVLSLASGLVGIGLHYNASAEFQREVDPSIEGRALVWKAMQAKAPPALAPGVMVQLGLLGLAFAFRHPVMTDEVNGSDSEGA